jgi:glutamine synthetase
MGKVKLEYIWLDGYKPTQSLRSKTKIESDFSGKLEDLDMWSFDGSSTEQAPGGSSDCLLKPVFVIPDPQRKSGYLVMCEVLNADGTPHESNGRATIDDDDNDFWFGFEQEYFLWDPFNNKPVGFPSNGYPGPQGPYYCSVGAQNAYRRDIVEEHLDACLEAGLNVEGINAEVAAGQWEFQVSLKVLKKLATKLGLPVIYWKELVKNMAYLSTGIANLWALWIGTDLACTRTSPTQHFVQLERKKSMTKSVKPSAQLLKNISKYMVQTTICV